MDEIRRKESEANIIKLEAETEKLQAETRSITYRDALETIKVQVLAVGVATTLVVGIVKLMGL